MSERELSEAEVLAELTDTEVETYRNATEHPMDCQWHDDSMAEALRALALARIATREAAEREREEIAVMCDDGAVLHDNLAATMDGLRHDCLTFGAQVCRDLAARIRARSERRPRMSPLDAEGRATVEALVAAMREIGSLPHRCTAFIIAEKALSLLATPPAPARHFYPCDRCGESRLTPLSSQDECEHCGQVPNTPIVPTPPGVSQPSAAAQFRCHGCGDVLLTALVPVRGACMMLRIQCVVCGAIRDVVDEEGEPLAEATASAAGAGPVEGVSVLCVAHREMVSMTLDNCQLCAAEAALAERDAELRDSRSVNYNLTADLRRARAERDAALLRAEGAEARTRVECFNDMVEMRAEGRYRELMACWRAGRSLSDGPQPAAAAEGE